MDTNRQPSTPWRSADPIATHVRIALATLVALVVLAGGLSAALWLASFILYASLRLNPLHAGLWGWPDALLAWHDGQMLNIGWRLASSVLISILLTVVGPATGLYAVWERIGRRRLYGSARFANEAEIRAAGLL